jgi:uncharacterized membrane protein
MRFSWRTEWPHWLLLAGMFALTAWSWPTAPDRIPMHWNLHGRPDGYGGRFEGLFAIPLGALAMYLLFVFLPRLDPKRDSYTEFAGAYGVIRFGTLAVMAAVHVLTLSWIHGRPAAIQIWVPTIVGALFLAVGSVLGRVRPNWFVGVRTPWTLSSTVAWERTNRAAGRLFLVLGAGLILLAVAPSPWLLWTVIGIGFVGAFGLMVYSYRLWRDDPEKRSPAGD